MLINTSSASDSVFLSKIAPPESSAPRVAAQAFYHCLALTTKGLLSVEQNEPYGEIRVTLAAASARVSAFGDGMGESQRGMELDDAEEGEDEEMEADTEDEGEE